MLVAYSKIGLPIVGIAESIAHMAKPLGPSVGFIFETGKGAKESNVIFNILPTILALLFSLENARPAT